MKFSQEDFQKNKSTSDAIQQFLLQTGKVFIQCKNVEAVALLLKRQPHIVKEKIESLQLARDKS